MPEYTSSDSQTSIRTADGLDTLRAVKTLESISSRIQSLQHNSTDTSTKIAVALGAAKALCAMVGELPNEWPDGSELNSYLFDLRNKLNRLCCEIQSTRAARNKKENRKDEEENDGA